MYKNLLLFLLIINAACDQAKNTKPSSDASTSLEGKDKSKKSEENTSGPENGSPEKSLLKIQEEKQKSEALVLFEEDFTIDEVKDVKLFTLKNLILLENFEHIQQISLFSEQLKNLKFNIRNICLYTFDGAFKQITPAITLDQNYNDILLDGFFLVKIDGKKILSTLETEHNFSRNREILTLSIELLDQSSTGLPVPRAIVLIPIGSSDVCEDSEDSEDSDVSENSLNS